MIPRPKFLSRKPYSGAEENKSLVAALLAVLLLGRRQFLPSLPQNNSGRDHYHKGIPRPYLEAKSLHVIDRRIAHLIDVMNCEPLIFTTGSCQGHGHVFVKVPPYISFKSSIDVASALARVLSDDLYSSPAPKLNYYWELNAHFDSNSELTYVLNIPGISSGKWFYATRRGVDQDFKLIGLMIQEILDHFKSKNVEMKGCKNQA